MTDLPNGWKKVRFGDTFKVRYGKAIDKALRKDSARYPVVGSAGIMTYTDEPLTEEPTIVIGRKGNVGSIQIFEEGCYPIDTTYYMQSTNQFNIKFLTLLLTSLELVKLDSSTATPSLRREDLENVSFFVPPLPEQQKIVEILEDHLSRLDAALADVKQAKLKAAQFRRSLLQAAFTGNLTGDGTRIMTDLPDGWSLVTLNEAMAECKNGLTYRNNPELAGFPVSRIETISKGEIDFEKVGYGGVSLDGNQKHLLNPGDILFSHINSMLHVGKVAIYRSGMPALLHGMNLLRITPNDAFMPEFLFYLFQSSDVRKQIWSKAKHAVNQASINIGELKTVVIPKPPVDEQHKIVELLEDHLSRLDASVAIADAMEKQSSSLRRSLLQAAFTGQLTKEVASV
jgi:type I restriction enzyme S subunit